MEKKKHIVRNILIIIGVLFLALCGFTAYGVKDYIDRVPDISPYEGKTFSKNCELLPGDLAEITVSNSSVTVIKRIIDAKWADGTCDELAISENGEALRVGDKTGVICVWVQATGVEAREAECMVRITE